MRVHKADLVAGVGPLLAKEAERLSEQILRVPALHGFVPGTEIGTPVEPSYLNQPLHLPRKLKARLRELAKALDLSEVNKDARARTTPTR
ncbi:hypothetical protein [Streptomyces sp. T028]|uniref:hypothetical protein n=1 Tax=Streptomyces sp. T028 TaxID=3394379 RepID=UPI003A8B1DDD